MKKIFVIFTFYQVSVTAIIKNVKIFFIKILKKESTIRFISFFNILFNDYLIYYAFKNSIRTGQSIVANKLFNILNKKRLNKKLDEKFFVSKVVYFEVNFFLKKNFTVSDSEKRFHLLKKFIEKDYKNKKIFFLHNKFFLTKDLFSLIVTEFIFCDCLIPIYKKYLEAEYFLNFKESKKNNIAVELDYHWFKAIGHYFLLDSLIKGIFLKLIPIQKIYFKIKKDKIANLYLYNFYKNLLIKNNLFLEKKKLPLLNMRLFYIKKFDTCYDSEQIFEYIQEQWKNKFFFKNNRLTDFVEKKQFNELKRKFFGDKKIITVHIRQNGFHSFEDDNSKIRNSDLFSTLETLNSISSSFIYVLMGGNNIPKFDKKFNNIFNYARSKLKSEINDILLMKYCDAHIGTTSGITHLTLASNQPTLLINWYPFEYALKNSLCVIVPKLLKKDNKIFSIRDYYKIKPNILFDGFGRLKSNYGITYRDNIQEEIFFALDKFIKSLTQPNWINYGIEYEIEKKNFDFHRIHNNMNKEVLNIRNKIYFDPFFIEKNKGFI
jgi:putative glycosyltransferase (TIGR04372 family)